MANNIKHNDLLINQEKPFENCKLNREQYAEILTKIVSNYKDGFVLAVNNKWGTGKTTFIKMWEQYLKNKQFKTIYFNAWENDFENDPLVALISEINSLAEKKTEKLLRKFIKNAVPLAKNLGIGLVKKQVSRLAGDEFVKEATNSFTEEMANKLLDQVNSYLGKKESIKAFRDSLEEFAKASSEDKPIVFFIDELDRCRPNYAVEVLEKVKHLFSVKGIVFVLSIDKTQLENAVCGVYGSDKIDANEYLRRFIDLEYSIPEPDTKLFCNYLYEVFDFKKIVFETQREVFHTSFQQLFLIHNVSLRDIEKLFAHILISISMFRDDKIYIKMFLTLFYLRTFDNNFYKYVLNKKISTREFNDGLFQAISVRFKDDNDLEYLITALTYSYNNYLDYRFGLDFNYERVTDKIECFSRITPEKFEFNPNIEKSEFWRNYSRISSDRQTNFDLKKYLYSIEIADRISFD